MINNLRAIDPARLLGMLEMTPDSFDRFSQNPAQHYGRFYTPKKNGGRREIRPPRKWLRQVQRGILDLINSTWKPMRCWHGGIRRRSVLSNAKPHIGRYLVANFDIEKFFPSTSTSLVHSTLIELGMPAGTAGIVTSLVTLENQLPQGAPTSTVLSNFVLARADRKILRVVRKHELAYTRYVDDLTISGDKDFRHLQEGILNPIRELGFRINDEKLALNGFRFQHERQIVTGLVVNQKLRPTREFTGQTRDWIRSSWNESEFELLADTLSATTSDLRSKIWGRISFLKSIDRKLGRRLKGLLFRPGVEQMSHLALPVEPTLQVSAPHG